MDTSQDNESAEGKDYNKLLANLKSYLPFLNAVIEHQDLGIKPEHLDKLRSLYNMVDSKRLSTETLKSCQNVFYNLYSKYNKLVSNVDVNMSESKKLIHSDKSADKNKLSEVSLSSNKKDQNLNEDNELINKLSALSTPKNKTLDNKEEVKKHLKQNQVPIIDKFTEKTKNSESSSIRNVNRDDSSCTSVDLPEFSDSRLRLNKVIGFAANASIEKLNLSDITVSQSELAQQIFDEISKQNKNTVTCCKKVLQYIDIDSIDVSDVKKVIEGITNTSVSTKSVQQPLLSPANGRKFYEKLVSNDNFSYESTPISTVSEIQPDSSFIPNKSTSIREKLNSEINVIHKIGSSNDSKHKVISSLKPGTLIDLENSKVSRSSLHIESLRPTIISSEKNSEPKQCATEKVISRDPRIKNRPLLNPENITNPIQTIRQSPMNITPITQNQCLNIIPSLLQPNINNSISTSFESKTQEMTLQEASGPNESIGVRNPTAQTNIQSSAKKFPADNHGNSNKSQLKNSGLSIQNQFKQNDLPFDGCKNNLSHNSNQIYVKPTSNNKAEVRNSKTRSASRIAPKKQFHSYKEFREAKYGKQRNSHKEYIKKNGHNRNLIMEDERLKFINKTDSKNLNPCNESGGIKAFKIPKINRREDIVDNILDKDMRIDSIEEMNMRTVFTKNKNTNKNLKLVSTERNYTQTDEDLVVDKIKENSIETNDNNTIIDLNLIGENIIDLELKTIENTENYTNQELKAEKSHEFKLGVLETSDSMSFNDNKTNQTRKPKRPKKYSKEKEFEKIVKEAVDESLNGKSCPRVRTRSSLKNKEETPIKSNLKDSNNLHIKMVNEKKLVPEKFSNNIQNLKENLNESNLKDSKNTYIEIENVKNSALEKFLKNVMNKEDSLNTSNLKDSINMENDKSIIFEKCKIVNEKCKIVDEKSDLTNNTNVNGSIETGQNIISSTSKESSELDNVIDDCKISEENVVSSNEINSTDDKVNKTKIDEKVLINILANPKLISILQDEGKITKLTKLLESTDITVDENKSNKNILDEENTVSKKSKRKLLKEERKRKKKMKKMKMITVNEDSSFEENKNEPMNFNSNDDSLNKEESMTITNEAGSSINDSSDNENGNSEIYYDNLSLDHVKSNSSKRKNSKENLGHFEVQDKYCKSELKDLKIIISKYDKNMKKSENFNPKELTYNIQTSHNPSSNKRKEIIKPKKPFLGPLSVKLARQKMDLLNELHELIERPVKNSLEFKTTNNISKYESKNSKSKRNDDEKYTINSQLMSDISKGPYVVLDHLICLNESSVSKVELKEKNIENDLTIDKKNSNTINPCASNTIDNKLESKKPRAKMTELDKLHADISENCATVLNISNIRHCRKNKQIDYVNTYVMTPNKNKTSNGEDFDSSNDKEKLDKQCKKSTYNSNNKKQNTKNTLSHLTAKTALVGKKSNVIHPGKLSKKKSKLSKKKQKRIQNFKKSLHNIADNQVNSEVTSLMLSDNEFKDKLYFQSAHNVLKCKFCHYSDAGLNIVRHYKEQHIDEEVLPSRLSQNCAELLINESLKNNFGCINYEQPEDLETTRCVSFTCIFCKLVFDNFVKFYDHITGHTGEYRYKCKMCEQIYYNENLLEEHILIHSDYDKTDGISYLLIHDPVQSTNLFGYLCSFCYFIQLDYNNVVQHMILRHSDEDKKCNGHWAVIRVNLSGRNENCSGSVIDYKNLVGCLPPLPFNQETHKTVLKDKEYRTEILQVSVKDIIAQTKQKLQVDPTSVKKEISEQLNMIEDPPESSILSPIQTDKSNEHIYIREDPPEASLHLSPIQITQFNENKCTASEDASQSVDENKSIASEDLPNSDINILPIQFTQFDENKCTSSEDIPQSGTHLSPTPKDQSNEYECTMSEEDPEIEYFKYTLKDKSKKCMVAGLSCELLNSVLLFKCSASKCQKIQYSTVVYTDFLKHIELEHQFLEWNGTCYVCNLKLEKVVDHYYLKDALEHLTSHHLITKEKVEHLTLQHMVTKTNNQLDTSSIIDLTDEMSPSIQQNNIIQENTIKEKPKPQFLRPRNLPGDTLSRCDVSTTREEKRNFNEDSRRFVLKDGCKGGIVGSIYCEQINSMLLFKCVDKSCPNEFSTVSYKELSAHIELYHKISHWDSMCNICGYGLWRNLFHLYMNNALDHLLNYHLVDFQFSENVMPPKANNLVVANDSFPVDNMPPRSTNADCKNDIDDNVKQTIEEIIVADSEQSGNIINNPYGISVNQMNTSKDSNKLSPRITNVRSLKKIDESMNSSNISPSSEHSNNYDSNLSMSVGILCENVVRNPEIFLEPGQQLINLGKPNFNTSYCLIDADYKKSYFNQIRQKPLRSMKTRIAFAKLMTLPKLLSLYKCLDRCCTSVFNDKDLFKLHMKGHYSNLEKKKKNQIDKVQQFKKCVYCLKKFDDENSLAEHITEKYKFCKYFCSYCFYRAYAASHVLIHQSLVHKQFKCSILQLEHNNDEENDENSEEILKAVDFNHFVRPYRCDVGGCLFICYVAVDFITHLNQKHQQCDKFCCYICADQDSGEGFFALQPKLMISHFKLHTINTYQCIFCLFGTEIIDTMLNHLAMEHFEYEPLCLERSPVSSNMDSGKIENLKIIRIKKPIEDGLIDIVKFSSETNSLLEISPPKTKTNCSKRSDVLSVAMKSACIDENNQPADTIVITVPNKGQMIGNNTSIEPIDSEFIMLDDANQNQTHETLKINNIWSESESYREKPQQSNNDVIVIDDEDENDKLNNEECIQITYKEKPSEEIDQPKKIKRLTRLTVELDKLFACNECDKVFSNGNELFNHLNVCSFWNGKKQHCDFCSKSFKSTLDMIEHLQLHGPKRFQCYLCSIYLSSQLSITNHMKHNHNILDVEFTPENSELSDFNKDKFIVSEKRVLLDSQQHKTKQYVHNYTCSECLFKGNTRKMIITHMKNIHHIEQYEITMEAVQSDDFTREFIVKNNESANVFLMPQQQGTSSKRKRSNNVDHNKGKKQKCSQDTKKGKDLVFDPDTIDKIPKSHIFSEPIGCLLCTYNTKVRSNLIIHLNGHTRGQGNTTKEIVNPVPSMGKSELMFDKMINLSASSFDAMNTEKNKNDKINQKIVEVAPQSTLNMDSFPKFVPNNIRYKCSIPCTYTCITEDMLKTHISILHPDSRWYLCPHCPQNSSQTKVELNKIEFHLMYHGENLYKCQYCDYIDFNRNEMKTHMRNTHLTQITSEKQSNIIVIRQTVLEDIIIDRNKHQDVNIKKNQSTVADWICKICVSSLKYTEQSIKSHIFSAHNLSSMFKCPMCQFEHENDDAKIFEQHYKLYHPSVAVKCLRVFEKITDEGMQFTQPEVPGNMLEQQALESIEPSLVPPTCRGIPVESVSANKNSNKAHGISKSPKSKNKTSPLQARKQKMLKGDVFNKNDSLGMISTIGLFVCPRCDDFETMNVEYFRDHLYKDVKYKTWKCVKCFEISDSPKKMAWHVKKHGNGSKYEKIEDVEKLKWVERVIKHQSYLFNELKKDLEKAKKDEEQNKTVVISDKKLSNSPLKKKNIESETKVLAPQLLDGDVINLLEDSDDE